jgi:hypothetical protein
MGRGESEDKGFVELQREKQMSKKTGSEIRRERRGGQKPEVDEQGARKELKNSIIVAAIVFLATWLIIFIAASDMGMFGAAPEKKKERTREQAVSHSFAESISAGHLSTGSILQAGEDTSRGGRARNL